jgi:glycine/D-amino acid oxidase-like deaminating enzyme
MRSSTSFAILGAGASGLTLARRLADLGFTRIVVFEQSAEVGGKSCTIDIDGRAHDLGATMGVPIDYRDVLELSREADLSTAPLPTEQHYDLAHGGIVRPGPRRDLPRVLVQTAKYLALLARAFPGDLHRAEPELAAPWQDVVARHRLVEASRRMLCYRTGFGYGFDDEVPAAMYANLITPRTLLGLATGSPFVWQGGTQPIWKALASRLAARVDIRLATPVTRIVRGSHGVQVWTGARVEHFDRLVITCDPKHALGVLDASATEQRWFSQVRTYPYSTFACEIEGLSTGRATIGYIDANMRRDRIGHPMAWVKRYADRDLCVFHLFAPNDVPDREIARRIADDVARIGGRFIGVRAVRRWSFFPHFSSEAMRAGSLGELDRWQGQHRTYLIGEALSFATMARVVEHATRFASRIAHERDGAVVGARTRLAS